MAPTKKDAADKEAKLTPEQSTAVILDYLRKQNRPFSATDISTNLKNRVTKAAAAKLLKDMHERNEIEGRAAGKQWVYHTIQKEPDEQAKENLQAMEDEIKRIREATAALKNDEKELRLQLRDGASRVPLPELQSSVTALSEQKENITTRLTELQSGSVQPVSLQEREEVDREWRKFQMAANARKRIRLDLWQHLESGMEKDEAADLKEKLDLAI